MAQGKGPARRLAVPPHFRLLVRMFQRDRMSRFRGLTRAHFCGIDAPCSVTLNNPPRRPLRSWAAFFLGFAVRRPNAKRCIAAQLGFTMQCQAGPHLAYALRYPRGCQFSIRSSWPSVIRRAACSHFVRRLPPGLHAHSVLEISSTTSVTSAGRPRSFI